MGVKKISSKELSERLNNGQQVFILDVRAEEKINDFQIKHPSVENKNIDKSQFLNEQEIKNEVLSSLPKNTEILIVCTTGNSANKVAEKLASEGFQTSVLEGGVTSWKERIEVEKNQN